MYYRYLLMLRSHYLGLVFTGSYYCNSMLPQCPTLLSFWVLLLVTALEIFFCLLKLCPHCHRKRRLSPKTATVDELPFSATVAVFGDKLSPKSATGRLKMQALSNAIPWKWRTKSQPWNLQDLDNEGPNRIRRGWKMQDQFDLKKIKYEFQP